MEMDDNKRYHCKIKRKGSIYFLSPPFLSFSFNFFVSIDKFERNLYFS